MSQTVGELFISLGVKGADSAFKALSATKNAITDLSAQGIAAKAAVLGAVYALEQFSAQSASYGNNLQNFNTLTGVTTTRVQQMAEAIREATKATRGESTQSAEGFFKGFQESVANWQMAGDPHGKFAGQFSAIAGYDLNNQDPTKFFEAIQRFVRDKRLTVGQQNNILQGMGGISNELIVTARKFGGDFTQISKNIESEGMVKALDRTKGQFSDLFLKFDRFKDVMTAEWSLPILTQLNKGLDILEGWNKKLWEIYKNPLFSLKNPFQSLGDKLKEMGVTFGNENTTPLTHDKIKKAPSGADVLKDAIKAGSFLWDKINAIDKALSIPTDRTAPQNKDAGKQSGSQKHTSIKVDVHQYGVKDDDATEAHKNEVARAYYSIGTIGQVV